MSGLWTVTGPAVVLALREGGEQYLYRGALVPAEVYTPASVKHAAEVGLLTPVEPADGDVEPVTEAPAKPADGDVEPVTEAPAKPADGDVEPVTEAPAKPADGDVEPVTEAPAKPAETRKLRTSKRN